MRLPEVRALPNSCGYPGATRIFRTPLTCMAAAQLSRPLGWSGFRWPVRSSLWTLHGGWGWGGVLSTLAMQPRSLRNRNDQKG